MPTFRIIWTSYDTPFPDIVTEKIFFVLKCSNDKKYYAMKMGYFRQFYWCYLIILAAVGFILSEYLGIMKHGGILEFLEMIFVIIGAFTLIYLVLSSVSYLSNHYDSKQYLEAMQKNITASNNYIDFCINMSRIDKRYIMHLQRVSSSEQ